jgi:hypothetical protein
VSEDTNAELRRYEPPEISVLGTVDEVTRGGATIFGDIEFMASPTTLSRS